MSSIAVCNRHGTPVVRPFGAAAGPRWPNQGGTEVEKSDSRTNRTTGAEELAKPATLQYGYLKPLPEDCVGERHVVIVKREPTSSPGCEWCQFEERRGAAPPGLDDDSLRVYLTQ